jgi:DDE family transposase
MVTPTFADYVSLLFTLFEHFMQQHPAQTTRRGHPFVYQHKALIVFFVVMQQRHIFRFKAMRRWRVQHPEAPQALGLETMPVRATLSRRYKALYPVVQDFIASVGQYAENLDPRLDSQDLYTDKSLFKAQGPVWPQSDRCAGRIPEQLRHLDTDASWGKSGSQGWVYGYGLHLTGNRAGFPKLAQVDTGMGAESPVLDAQADQIRHDLGPSTLTADDRYTQARRIRQWAKQGVLLLTPALKWVKGRYATAYHGFIAQPENADLLHSRRTAIEPIFDLVAKVLGTTATQKPLPLQKLANVRTCLVIATLTIQVAMIANSIWGLPLRNISTMAAAFT